jgi:hypothetical protein
MEGFEVNTPELRRVADGLEAESGNLRSRRIDPTPRPDAGRSTGEAGGAVAYLVDKTADLANVLEYLATRLRETADNYDSADNVSMAEMAALIDRRPPVWES